ncbi:MAG: DUF4388 domain-containing protein [Candidatus Aminicenantes bacterium]|nr:MAG: DUF4388 domain-containing protein [Candidatus Aminicenantes bacterium]
MTDFSHIPVPLEGEIKEENLYSILYYIYKESISGTLVVQTENVEKKMLIENNKIVFAASNGKEDAFGDYLLKNNLIDKDIYHKTSQYMEKNNKRFGRALIELGYFNYEQLWTWIPNHLKAIVFSFFDLRCGTYRILMEYEKQTENIVLDMDILSVIVEGMRRFNSKTFLEKKFAGIEHLYVIDSKTMTQLDLKPYEIHVFDLVRKVTSLKDILRQSELLEFDTLKLLYLFLILEIISPQKSTEESKVSPGKETAKEVKGINASTFNSFEEAIRYYNMKYEIIYKVMLKEIGPISLSLLLKAVEDIMDNLPSYLQKIQLNPDGSINEELVLKSVWYYDFDEHIGEFLRGLEEILYTEIYAVKKHLGVEYEQQVLKWINGIGI